MTPPFFIFTYFSSSLFKVLVCIQSIRVYSKYCDTHKDCVDHNKLWKILKEMGIPDHLTCLLRNLYTDQKAKHQRIEAFELWCWRRVLRVLWTARRSSQSILKEISPEYSLEGLMLKLKLQYFGHLTGRTDSFEKTLMLGMIEGRGEGDDRG